MWGNIFYVAIGGAMGAVCRYGLSLFAARFVEAEFAWGTLSANLIGCFFIGIALALAEAQVVVGSAERLFFMTGFLGALTTFSTYALESVQFARSGVISLALVNLLVNHVLGIGLVIAGLWLGTRLGDLFGGK